MIYTVRLEIARCPDFPEGSAQHGYALRLPLDASGKLDPSEWAHRHSDAAFTRFWGEESEGGRLVHGRKGWALAFAGAEDAAEPIFRSDEHRFAEGEYVSIIERDGVTRTFRVVSVAPH